MGVVIPFRKPSVQDEREAREPDPVIDVHIDIRAMPDGDDPPVPCLVARHRSGAISEVPISWSAVLVLTDCNIPASPDIDLEALREHFGV